MARKALLGNVTDNDLRLLRVFRAVVACGGFAASNSAIDGSGDDPQSLVGLVQKTWRKDLRLYSMAEIGLSDGALALLSPARGNGSTPAPRR